MKIYDYLFECRVESVSEEAIKSLKGLLVSCVPSLKQTIFEKAIEIVMKKLRQPDLSQLAIIRSFSVLHMMKKDVTLVFRPFDLLKILAPVKFRFQNKT